MSPTIIYIEDNPFNMQLVQRAVSARGYQFLYATNGEEGLALIESQRPQLILLDINLPDIDGYEIARRLRSHPNSELAKTPILAITANALSGDVKKALAAGCNDHMPKPISIRDLWDRLDRFLSPA